MRATAMRCKLVRQNLLQLLMMRVALASSQDALSVRCLDRAEEMVHTLRLLPMSHTEKCGMSVTYVDAKQTLVLKHYMLSVQHTPRQRETCILQALQRFSWAPRWLCTGTDYLLSSYSGQPACKERVPPDYLAQVGNILSDIHSIGIRHNDLHKETRTDFLVNARTGRVSLTDYGWSTVNGSLGTSCKTAHGGRVLIAKASRPDNKLLTDGMQKPEAPESVSLPGCHGLYAGDRMPQLQGFVRPYESFRKCQLQVRRLGLLGKATYGGSNGTAGAQFQKFVQRSGQGCRVVCDEPAQFGV